jgi:hypothetical protein
MSRDIAQTRRHVEISRSHSCCWKERYGEKGADGLSTDVVNGPWDIVA